MAANWKDWALDRFGLRAIKETVLDRQVPLTPWYFGDGASLLMLFGVQALTGAVMALSYSPTPDTAYESVRYITQDAPAGWFVRGLHYWGAGIMVVMVFFHLFRVLLVGSYKAPREGTYLIGVPLLFAVFIMGFTGYVLRWDEQAIYATTVVTHMFNKVPVVGNWLELFVQGGEEIGARTLTRMYAVHMLFVPALMGLLIGYHLYLVIKKGVTTPSERRRPVASAEEQRELYRRDKAHGETFFPYTAVKSALMALGVFIIVLSLTFFSGRLPMGREANLVEPAFPQEEWWYWWYSSLIALVPGVIAPWLIVLFPPLLFLALVLLPLLDRNPHRQIKHRPLIAIAVGVSVILLIGASLARVRSPWTGYPTTALPPVPQGVTLTPEAEQGRLLYSQYGCNSCHAIAGQGARVGPDLTWIGRALTREQVLARTLAPLPGSSMPNDYGERMTPEEVSRLIDFLMQLSAGRLPPQDGQASRWQ